MSAHEIALDAGVVICDTKFEFGVADGELLLADEVLTPDSSRFWPAAGYRPGIDQPSFDKQFVRDYLDSTDWDRTPPAPVFPTRSSPRPALSTQRHLSASPGSHSRPTWIATAPRYN